MPSTSGAQPYSHLIITPDIKTPSPEPYDALAAQAKARAEWLDNLHQQTISANAMRENAADSPGFNVGHEKNQQLAANIGRGALYFRGQAQLYTRMAQVMRDIGSAHENIDTIAHNELAAAKTNFERGAIIATHHGDARIAAVNGVEMLGSYYTDFKANYGSDAVALTGRLGNLPLASIHRWAVGVPLISVVVLWAGERGGVGVDDRPTSVSGCSCWGFVSRDGLWSDC